MMRRYEIKRSIKKKLKYILGIAGVILILALMTCGWLYDSFTNTAILILAMLRTALFIIPLFVRPAI